MKSLILGISVSLAFIVACELQAAAQEGYTFIATEKGPAICLGRWIPPSTVGLPGTCDGQMLGLPQLTAISTRQSVDRLDQLLGVMNSIDTKLTANNEQINQLIQATLGTQNAIDRQVNQVSEFLRETITRRFAELPQQILDDEVFRSQLEKMKNDIIGEVEKRYPARPATKKEKGR